MADRHAIADLFADYGAANDLRDVALIGDCFTADGAFLLHIAGGQTIGPLEPRDEVLAFFGAAFGAQSDQRRHVVTNIRLLESDDDRARVRAYLTLIVTDGGRTALQSAGRYDAEVVADGEDWRFRSLTLFLDSPF